VRTRGVVGLDFCCCLNKEESTSDIEERQRGESVLQVENWRELVKTIPPRKSRVKPIIISFILFSIFVFSTFNYTNNNRLLPT